MQPRLFLTICFAAVLSGCAPSFSPLYRDYDIEPPQEAARTDTASTDEEASREGEEAGQEIYARIRAALADAGWVEAEPAAPNVVSTEPRQLSDWGLYQVLVSLDIVPLGDRHVRVLFHPARRYFTGGRSKIPYLDSGMRRALLPDLNEALEAQGFVPIGTPRERDEEHVAGT